MDLLNNYDSESDSEFDGGDDDDVRNDEANDDDNTVGPVGTERQTPRSTKSKRSSGRITSGDLSAEDEHSASSSSEFKSLLVDAAPKVDDESRDESAFNSQKLFDSDSKLTYNPLAAELWAGGDLNSQKKAYGAPGTVERLYMNEHIFRDNLHQFNSRGYAMNPTSVSYAGKSGPSVVGIPRVVEVGPDAKVPITRRRKEASSSDASEFDSFKGPWARYQEEVDEAAKPKVLTDEQKAYIEVANKKKQRASDAAVAFEETTEFHGEFLKDYLGRSFLDVPSGFKAVDHVCFVPRKRIHTWSGFGKGVSSIRFLPNSGHLLLAAALDGVVKIFDVNNQRKCIRTYSGHAMGVRDAMFNADGRRFLTTSYDKFIKLWDTETGQVISRFNKNSTANCVTFHPTNQEEFLSGMSDKAILQWDLRTNEVIQEYKEHMGAVNTITFLPRLGGGNEHFISSSDDKKLFIWDYGVPVVTKQIAEPDLHSIPSIALHPSGKHFVGNANDNQVLVFACANRVKLNRRKRFLGHATGGFACGLTFSPDGKFLASGDAQGRIFFWDWKTGKRFQPIYAHQQVTIAVRWHPVEPSRVASCSWDGYAKYWD